jgi:hypothetical protein
MKSKIRELEFHLCKELSIKTSIESKIEKLEEEIEIYKAHNDYLQRKALIQHNVIYFN